MKLSEVKHILSGLSTLTFQLEDGSTVPSHFHVTEVGVVNKQFIDCGGTIRKDQKITFQLWTAEDFDHRLGAQKMNNIIELSQRKVGLPDAEVEVEYQGRTIGLYSLDFNGEVFILKSKQTDCLAKDNCGIPVQKRKLSLAELGKNENSCAPGSGCC